MRLRQKHIIIGVILALLLASFFALDPLENTQDLSERDFLIREQRDKIESNLKEWFDGNELNYYVGNNRSYDWYIDQMNTGQHSNNNCGPSSAVMSLKWLNENFDESAEDARKEHYPQGGWWTTNIIQSYLSSNGVEYGYVFFDSDSNEENIQRLKSEIEDGGVVILCIDMEYIPREDEPTLRINRFYDYADGHFVVAKGDVEVDNEKYFEVYDPNNWGKKYKDGSPMGKDRYFEANALIKSAINWWDTGYVIKKPSEKSTN
jgi:hypothetical protein